MKKSQLIKVIRESINKLITEQSNLPTGLPIMVNHCGWPTGGNIIAAGSSQRYLVEEPNGTVRDPQIGDVWCADGVTSGTNNWSYFEQYGCRMNTVQITYQCDGCDWSNLQYGTSGNYIYGTLPHYGSNPQLYGLDPHGNGQCSPSCGLVPKIKPLITGCNDASCPDGPTATTQGNCSMNLNNRTYDYCDVCCCTPENAPVNEQVADIGCRKGTFYHATNPDCECRPGEIQVGCDTAPGPGGIGAKMAKPDDEVGRMQKLANIK
tara:strand:+ start:29 stop:820 length:792 start_codon:yes stop_codon:yes gene_type:complete